VHAMTFAVCDPSSGAPLYFANVSLDITESKKAEEALRESEERVSTSMENAPDGIYMNDLEGNFLYGNRRCEQIIGYKREELIGKNFLELNILPQDSLARAAQILQDNTDGKSTGPDELALINRDGRRVPIEINTSVLQRGNEKVVLAFVRDITDRKKAEGALKESEERYRALFDRSPDLVYVRDLNGNFIDANPAALGLLGYRREDIPTLNFASLLDPSQFPKTIQILKELTETGFQKEPGEFRLKRKDGTYLHVETQESVIYHDGKPHSVQGVGRDITERKKAEETLKISEERYRFISDNTADVIWAMDSKLRYTYMNHSITRQRGYTVEEARKLNLTQVLTPGSQDTVLKRLQAETLPDVDGKPRKTSTFTQEMEMYRKDGTTIWTETSVTVLRTPLGEFDGLLGVSRDITERKQAEEALQGSEERYRALVENINDVFYALDTQGNITYVSPVVERFTLYKVSDLIGKPFIPLIYPDDLPALLDSFNRLVSGHLEPWEFRILDKDGRVIWVRTSSRPTYQDGETVGITALMTDITERKQMEHKLEEMATHDFLTGLPNRILLLDRFNIAAALAHRNKARLALMSLDLDKFKTINDTLGHDAGDQVLKAVSTRLTGIIRASDTLARVGGDEFILVMMETNHVEDATAIAQKILDSFTEPLSIDGRQLHLTTSIGIAIYPADAQDLETLTKKSDAAMYYSKGHGRNQFKFFSDGDVRISGDHRSAPLI
jgi:diguanylate cyclase (GGDEF)-like protein/PAS domain S-box-containing protein